MLTKLPSYNFHVCFGLVPISIGFQKISGIQYGIETITYQEGGNNRCVHVFPKSSSSTGMLIMERGRFLNNDVTNFLIGDCMPLINIYVMDNNKTILKAYIVINSIVKKWSVSDLNANESALIIDRFELEYGEIYQAQ